MFSIAMCFLFFKQARRHIFVTPHQAGRTNAIMFYGVRLMGAVAGFFQNYAISIGSVIIVNALQGFQFVFLLAATGIITIYFPHILQEKLTPSILLTKLAAIIIITAGLVMVAL